MDPAPSRPPAPGPPRGLRVPWPRRHPPRRSCGRGHDDGASATDPSPAPSPRPNPRAARPRHRPWTPGHLRGLRGRAPSGVGVCVCVRIASPTSTHFSPREILQTLCTNNDRTGWSGGGIPRVLFTRCFPRSTAGIASACAALPSGPAARCPSGSRSWTPNGRRWAWPGPLGPRKRIGIHLPHMEVASPREFPWGGRKGKMPRIPGRPNFSE